MPSAARLGDKAQVDADAHGCPACPHPAVGPIVTGSPDVFVNSKPAARQDDLGIHAVCCGPNTFTIQRGSPTVYVNGKPFARMNDQTRSEEHTSELQSRGHLVCRLLLEKK